MIKTWPWKLSDLKNISKNGKKVFSCFHCGGGSTMGYKLAGYDVIGGVEIDTKMMEVYRANHNPFHSFLMGVQEFNQIPNHELPRELFNLDILDGSPPCSSFSMSGNREKNWNESKKFREGQANQILDDLFFHFIETANKLKPKVVVAENVEGLILGKAKGYVKQIFKAFDDIGYNVQLFLLNASFMGVPQTRKRTFFIATKKELKLDKINLIFKEYPIPLVEAFSVIDYTNSNFKETSPRLKELWKDCAPGNSFETLTPGKNFNYAKLSPLKPSRTLTAKEGCLLHWKEPRKLIKEEICAIQTFPIDYNFLNNEPNYICGMSVPPFMMQRLASILYDQIFKNQKPTLESL
jgi:DNA (cytosine-5)-methyltransferase 1